jgi:hypothetical protein
MREKGFPDRGRAVQAETPAPERCGASAKGAAPRIDQERNLCLRSGEIAGNRLESRDSHFLNHFNEKT